MLNTPRGRTIVLQESEGGSQQKTVFADCQECPEDQRYGQGL